MLDLAAMESATALARCSACALTQSAATLSLMLARGAGAATTTWAGETRAKPSATAGISGGSLGKISNPVFSTGARSAGNLYAGSVREVPAAVISGVVVTGSFRSEERRV